MPLESLSQWLIVNEWLATNKKSIYIWTTGQEVFNLFPLVNCSSNVHLGLPMIRAKSTLVSCTLTTLPYTSSPPSSPTSSQPNFFCLRRHTCSWSFNDHRCNINDISHPIDGELCPPRYYFEGWFRLQDDSWFVWLLCARSFPVRSTTTSVIWLDIILTIFNLLSTGCSVELLIGAYVSRP